MEASAVQHTDKKLYRNNTAGWLGVVVLDHDNRPTGESVEPYGTVWLSDAEALLTARAPRRAEDNPFEQQVFIGVNSETQAREEFVMRPLTLADSDARYVPTERYVPGLTDAPREGAPPVTQTAAALADAPAPASAQGAQPPPPTPPAAPQGRAVPPVRTELTQVRSQPPAGEEEPRSWTEPPEAPGRVLPGSLQGGDGPPPAETARAAPDPTNAPTEGERYVPAPQAAPQTVGSMEEHAEAVDPLIGEETGAAQPPAAPPPAGEYAQAEEVGSPEAPTAQDENEHPVG